MVYSVNTQAALTVGKKNLQALSGNINRLSSGKRITRAADDVASLSIATQIAKELSASRSALGNINQASSLLDVANGGVNQITNILQRQQQLAAQANNGTLSDTERSALNIEFQNLSNEINRIAENTNFAGQPLLDGSLGNGEANGTVDTSAVNSYSVTGTINGGAVFDTTGGTADTGGTNSGVDISGINDADFQGELSDFNAVYDYDGAGNTLLSVDVNGSTYTAALNTGGAPLAAGSTITFSGNGGASTFSIDTSAGLNTANQTDADNLAGALDNAFSGVEFSQDRNVTSFDVSGFTPAQALNGATATYNGGDIGDNGSFGNIGPFSVQDTSAGGAGDASISVTIDGEVYTASGLGDASDTVNGAVTLQNQSDPSKSLTVNLAGPVYLGNETAAGGLQAELNEAFSVGSGAAGGDGLSVQTGSSAGDSINLNIGGLTTNSLFAGQSLDISTAAGAANAFTALEDALQSATSAQADIGAQQSQLDSARENVIQEIQNSTAAFSQLSDTDIASESSDFATNKLLANAGVQRRRIGALHAHGCSRFITWELACHSDRP